MSEGEGRIALDREALKVLASDTRIDILKLLDKRNHTVTELARELDLNKATCFEHLEKLSQVNLVQKLEDERKWVYYQLTWKGRRLLHPEKMAIALMLSTAFGSALAAFAAFWFWTTTRFRELLPEGGDAGAGDGPSPEGADEPASGERSSIMAEDAAMAAPEPVEPAPTPVTDALGDPAILALAIAATVLVVALLVGAYLVHRRMLARHALPA